MYQPLPSESPSDFPEEHEVEDVEATDPDPLNHRSHPYLPLLLCILFTLLNIVVTLASQRIGSSTNASSRTTPITHKNIHQLRRPSQYIRFDEVLRPVPPVPRQFENYPITLAQVDAADSGKVFEEDLAAYMSPIGTVVPGDRRVLVTPTVSPSPSSLNPSVSDSDECRCFSDFNHHPIPND